MNDFEFDDSGRHFICSVETPSHAGMQPWWWFSVVTEGNTTRYAPFEARPGDTRNSVQARIIASYDEILAIKARPVHQRPHWQRPDRPAVPAAPATPEAAVPS